MVQVNKQSLERITNSPEETERIGEELAKKILSHRPESEAVLLSLEGELGGGKTTFLKGFARGLRIKQMIKSPTFVIMKKYLIAKNFSCFRRFYHFDCYRISQAEEILTLGWEKIIKDPENIVAVEWADKIKRILPEKYIQITFKILDKNKRKISIINKIA